MTNTVILFLQVTLLDPKKSMNVNIFLKQFRKSNDNDVIIDQIKQGDARALGVEKLKGLLKILPQQDEVIQYTLYLHYLFFFYIIFLKIKLSK